MPSELELPQALTGQGFEDLPPPPAYVICPCCGPGLREKGQGSVWLSCLPHTPLLLSCGLKLLTSSSPEQESARD